MKYISRLLILCLLLCGCAKEEAVRPVADPPPETVAVRGLYEPGSNLEISSSGAVRVFPLGNRVGTDLLAFGEGLILFSGEKTTSLTLLTGEELAPTAVKTLPFYLQAADCHTNPEGTCLSYFDSRENQAVVLDGQLRETSRLDAPAGLVGKPMVSQDGKRMYYCTENGLRVWDLALDIHRTLKQTVPGEKTITGLFADDTVLAMEEAGGRKLVSTQTGELLYEEAREIKLAAGRDWYTAAIWETNLWSLILSREPGHRQALTPAVLASEFFLTGNRDDAVTGSVSGETVTLDYYELSSGKRLASQMFRGKMPLALVSRQDGVWILLELGAYEKPVICRWSPEKTPVADPKCYTGEVYTLEAPDRAGLEKCREDGKRIGSRYGMDILLWKEGAAQAPEGITLVPEYRVNILSRELELLDSRLAQFPEGMLAATAGNFTSLKLCLVSEIRGNLTGNQSLQFFRGKDACIVLAVGQGAQALHHELFHVMETHVFAKSRAFDRWDSLNPQGFQYDYDYQANAIRNSGIYLTEENRSFVDTFSMSYPKEDRARILEYAMLPEQEGVFRTAAMQKKLKTVCTGIREAYGLEEEGYPWEQYLR